MLLILPGRPHVSFASDPPILLSPDLTSPTTTPTTTDATTSGDSGLSASTDGALWSSPLSVATEETTSSEVSSTAGRSLYVSKSGSDSADGSEAAPWETIQRAVSELQAGDVLYILEGVYEESVKFVSSGRSDAYMTIQGVGNAVIDGTHLADHADGFDTQGHDFIRFRDLTINNTKAGIEVGPGSIYVEIDGLRADGNGFAVRIESSNNITVQNAYAVNSANAFRAFGDSRNLVFEDIETYGSKDKAFQQIRPDYLQGDGFVIEADVTNVTLRNIISGDHWDAGFDIKASNVLIENVTAFGNKNNFKTWGDNITIKSSLSRHAKEEQRPDGSYVEGNGITVESGTTRVINTTFVDNEDHDIRIYSGGALFMENSIVARRDSGGMLFGMSNNAFFSSDRVLWYEQEEVTAGVRPSATDVWYDPDFVDWDNGDYRLRNTSIAINLGSSAADISQYDLDGNDRLAGPASDLGAYEFQGVPAASKLKGLSHGDTVSGTIFVEPDRDALPKVRGVTYYLNGKQIYRSKKSPYTLGGSDGFDTTTLQDGTYILEAVVQISKKEQETISVAFVVNHTAPFPNSDPAPDPAPAPEYSLIGLSDGNPVSGTIFVRPDLTQLPPLSRVNYDVDGARRTEKKKPYTWGGGDGFDTFELSNGEHVLRVEIITDAGDVIEFSLTFTVLN